MQRTQEFFRPVFTCFSVALLVAGPAFAGSYTYTNLDVPGCFITYGDAISSADQVLANCIKDGNETHFFTPFFWSKGTFTQIPPIGQSKNFNVGAVNARAVVTGIYKQTQSSKPAIYLYNEKTGTFKTQKDNRAQFYRPTAINNSGTVVGYAGLRKSQKTFVLTGTRIARLSLPGATDGSAAAAINDSGAIVGTYLDINKVQHGYLYQGGTLTTIDVPGAISTSPRFITSTGVIGGMFEDSTQKFHGFTFTGGTYATFDYPGGSLAEVVGVATSGAVIGNYRDSNIGLHGFVNIGGTYHKVDFPGAVQTNINGFNENGSIVGYYSISEPYIHAFIAQCVAGQSPCTQ